MKHFFLSVSIIIYNGYFVKKIASEYMSKD